MKTLLFSICSLLFSATLMAQTFNQAKMDSLFQLLAANQKGMGTISIYQDGKEVYTNAIGFMDLANKKAATPATKYRIGSITKTFTATLILQLVEAGKLSLDTKLSTFFPEVVNAKRITIEQMLRHRSGIFNVTSAPDYLSWMEQPISRKAMVDKIVASGSTFDPGIRMEYSNSNYILLTYILEDLMGMSLAEALQRHICVPCGLTNTFYGGKINPANNEALSYNYLSGWQLATETDMSVPEGAGAFVSTASDVNRFFNCIFDQKVLSEASLKAMTQLTDGFGLGIFTVPFYDKQGLGHNGGIDGFISNSFHFPDDGVGITYLSNGAVMPLNDIMIGVLSIYFDKPYDLPDFSPALVLSSEDLDQYLGVYASPTFPLKLTFTKDGDVLMAQATGQSSFPLEAYGVHQFRFDPAGIKLEFVPAEQKVTLMQGGGTFEFTRE
ncbi:MAG: serine hydrolase domain-containing protein [Bacteroidota bacterium]